MAEIYKDAEGQEHEFPDGTTPEEMESAVNGASQKSPIEKPNGLFDQIPNAVQSGLEKTGIAGLGKNFSGGILNSIVAGLKSLPDMSKGYKKEEANPFLTEAGKNPAQQFDPYQFMGTKEQSIFKPGERLAGATQLAGELFGPGVGVKKSVGAMKPLLEKVKNYFSPGKVGEDILSKLGQGAKHAEENSKNLTSQLQEKYNQHKEQSGAYFQHVENRVNPKEELYETPNPLITSALDKSKGILKKLEDFNGELIDRFKNKQNFQNGHKLQSEMGDWIGELKVKPFKTPEENAQLDKIISLREQLKTDLRDFLKRRDANSNENLLQPYETGVKIHREGAAHYTENPTIGQIVKKGERNIKNIHEPFDTPTSKEEGIRKILGDLPETAKGQILFSKVGGLKNIKNPKALYRSLVDAEQNGFSEFFTPELKQAMIDMSAKMKHQKLLKKGAAWTAGVAPIIVAEEAIRRS